MERLCGSIRERAHLETEGGVRGHRSRGTPQQLQQVLAEVLPNKTVQDWVHAAVEKGNANGERHSGVNDLSDIAVADHFQQKKHVHEVEDLMRCPAKEKRQHSGGQHAQDLVPVRSRIPLNVPSFEQSPADQAVAREDDGDRQKEPKNTLHQTESCQHIGKIFV